MKFLLAILDGWISVVRSTWRAFLVFGGLVFLAIVFLWRGGGYDGMAMPEIVDDILIALALMFVASFITSLRYHYHVRRSSRWPGGGGRKSR